MKSPLPAALVLSASIIFSLSAQAAIPRERFFANPVVQREAPAAFALQPEAAAFLDEAMPLNLKEAAQLVRGIRSNQLLLGRIVRWKKLDPASRERVLREVFALEVEAMGTAAPELVIAEGANPNGAFFEFDLAKPGTGKVIISPEKLNEDNFESLVFLIHETRHSSQLQRAFGLGREQFPALSAGYYAAFTAQKALASRLVFCDFLTLVNEYEAFLFGNRVITALLGDAFEQRGMGTFASQLSPAGLPKIDLQQLHQAHVNVLEEFNRLEEEQFEYLQPKE